MPDEKDEKPTTQPDAEPKTTQNAGSETKAPEEKKDASTLDIVKANRERQSRAKDATAGKSAAEAKPEKPAAPEAGTKGKAADDAPDSEDDGDDEENGEGEFTFTNADLSNPGFYDRLTKEQWKVVEEKAPVAAAQYKAGQRALNALMQKGREKTTAADQKKPPAATEETDPDVSEAIDLLYDPKTRKEGLKRLLTNGDSKELLKGIVREALQEETGYDLALKPIGEGIELASSKYPQLLQDETFFHEVHDLLKQDEETYADLMSEKNPRLIAVAFREASATVVRSRAAKGKATEKTNVGTKDERRQKLERDTQAAKEQAGVKAGVGSRPGVTAAESGSTADLVRSIRQQKGYQHLKP